MRGRERERFVKLLSLTHSSNDGEALAALRKCNDMLKQHRLSWDDVVAGGCAEQAAGDTAQRSGGERPAKARSRKDGASLSRSFEASLRREEYFEQTRREENAVALRFYIRKVPLPLRLLVFPLWATAEMLVGMVVAEASTSWRAMKSVAAVLVLAVSSVIWLQAFEAVAALAEAAADEAVPWIEQAWQQLDGDQDRPTAGGTVLNWPFNRSR